MNKIKKPIADKLRKMILTKQATFSNVVTEFIDEKYAPDFKSAWKVQDTKTKFKYLEKTIEDNYFTKYTNDELESVFFENLL